MTRRKSSLALFVLNFVILFALAGLLIRSQQTAHGRNYPGDSFYGMWSFTQPPTSSWSWDNQGSSTEDTTYGYPYLIMPAQSAVKMSLRYRTAPSTPYTITAAIAPDITGAISGAGNALNSGIELLFRDSSGKIVSLDIQSGSSAAGCVIQDEKWTTSTSFSATYTSYGATATTANICSLLRNVVLMQMSDDGTNLTFRLSVDGNHWQQFDQRSRTNFFASGPSQVGWGSFCDGDQVVAALLSWQVTSP